MPNGCVEACDFGAVLIWLFHEDKPSPPPTTGHGPPQARRQARAHRPHGRQRPRPTVTLRELKKDSLGHTEFPIVGEYAQSTISGVQHASMRCQAEHGGGSRGCESA
jgi:hypothetical protein